MPTVGGSRNTWGGELNDLDFDAVSADRYSDPNDALVAAGPGGQVRFSKDTTYTLTDPLRVSNGHQLIGGDRWTTVIDASAAGKALETSDSGSAQRDILIDNLTFDGGDVATIGLDMRYISVSDLDRLRVRNFTDAGVRWGGQQATDIGGWSNTLSRSLIYAEAGGVALHYEGRVGSAGAPTANKIVVWGCSLYGGYGSGDAVVLMEHGEDNRFFGNDGGYGNAAGSVYWKLLGSLSRTNEFYGGRMENIGYAAYITGEYNLFFGGKFVATDATKHPIELDTGHQRNNFVLPRLSGGLSPSIYDLVTGAEYRGIQKNNGDIRVAGLIETNWGMKVGSTTTAGRPSAASNSGLILWDTTIGKMIRSDGTNWTDMLGATV